MRDVDHQNRAGLTFVECFVDLQIFLTKLEFFNAMIDLGVFQGFCDSQLIQGVSEGIGPHFSGKLISPTCLACLVVALF